METAEHTATRPTRAHEAPSSLERSEEVLSWAGVAAVATIRVVELAAITVAVLLVVPPLAILVVVVVVPVIALTVLAAVVAGPVFVVRRIADLGRSEQAATTSRGRRVVARAQRKLYAKPGPEGVSARPPMH